MNSNELEVIKELSKNIEMGVETLETLSKKLANTDNKIALEITRELESFKDFQSRLQDLCKEEIKNKKGNLVSVIMAKMETNKEFMSDNSDAKLADSLIQGYSMGLIKVTKIEKKYKNEIGKDLEKFIKDYKSALEVGIENVKKFL